MYLVSKFQKEHLEKWINLWCHLEVNQILSRVKNVCHFKWGKVFWNLTCQGHI